MAATLFSSLDRHHRRLALIEPDGRRLTYGEMLKVGDGLGQVARRQRSGRSLALVICRNDADCVAGYVGLMRAGMVVMMAHHSVQPAHLDAIIARFAPALLYAPAGFAHSGRNLASQGGYVLADLGHGGVDVHEGLALLLTTSGTTGSRNFVRLSGANIDANAGAIVEYLGIDGDQRPITTMPLSYTYGLSIVHSHLLAGAAVVLSEDSVVSPGFWQAMRAQAVTSMGGVPFIYDMLKKLRFARMDLPDLKVLTQAGGRMAPQLVSEFAEICAGSDRRFIVMYGQTEATARMSWLPWDEVPRRPHSIGKAIPGGRLWLEDEDGTKVNGTGACGELVYGGANVSWGYAKNAGDLCRGDDNGGILRTGDMAMQDEDGYFTIIGRRKRFLKVFGHRVNLDDLERLLHQAGLVCACGGADDRLMVYGVAAELEALKAAVSAATGLTSQMFRAVVVTDLPRQEAGKVDYAALEAAHG